MIDPAISDEMRRLIYAEIYRGPKVQSGGEFHRLLQRRLVELGTRLHYRSEAEHDTPWLDQNRSGRIDVFWSGHHRLAPVSIEIDSTWKEKSLKKLAYMSQQSRSIWIYYGLRALPYIRPDSPFAPIIILRADPTRLFHRPIRGRRQDAPDEQITMGDIEEALPDI